jgi:MoaA/NifB/PqqE/SkfB family radical SAM enzyme
MGFDIRPHSIKKMIANAGYLLAIGKPLVVIRYIEKLACAFFKGKASPRQIDIALTFDCNLACDHCFTTPLLNKNEQEMSYDTLKKIATDCKKLGITVIHFTGGEILMRQDLEEVIALFEPKKNVIYVQSNGILATYDRLKSLKKAGLDFYGVSLESPDKTEQDKFRHHDGYYDKALYSLELAKKAGLQTSVNITIDKYLIHSDRLIDLIDSLGKMGHIVYGNLPVPVGRFRDKRDLLWFGNERRILEDLTRRFSFFRTEFDSNFGPHGCPALKEKLYLCAYGDVLACPYIHVSLGNVSHESLVTIYNRGLEFPVFTMYHDHCLAAENKAFISRVIDKTRDFTHQPVYYKEFENELTTDTFKR